MVRRQFFRFQPKNKRLIGHTSECSNDVCLPKGEVFAYPADNPAEAQEWWMPEASHEAILFEGDGAYDPGDAEGVAVRPTRELRRMSLVEWTKWAEKRDGVNKDWYKEARAVLKRRGIK